MKFLVFGASLRKDSLNRRLARVAGKRLMESETAAGRAVAIDQAEFREFPMPVFDEDLETSAGSPAGADALIARIAAADAIILSSPEYNGSIPGPLKNAIDWVSRAEPVPLVGKPLLILAASPGVLGGTRGLWHTRVPFEVIGACVYPEMFSLPRAHEALVNDETLADPKLQARLDKLLTNFSAYARKLTKA